MKLAALIVAGDMSSEKVAVIAVLVGTPGVELPAVVAGMVSVTLGRVVSSDAPVVKVQTKLLASGTPNVSVAPEVIVAVHIVPAGRLADDVKVATRLAAI